MWKEGSLLEKKLPRPLGGNAMPRFGGPANMLRPPTRETAVGLNA